ncbi:MAG: hypothetical protein KDK99_16260 [Verrucomicrobiales bacterium]|nr:hypothetical protein [Verrucomicrobiales bacterium]
MKNLSSLLLALLFSVTALLPTSRAADGEIVYEGAITGIVCASCRSHVTQALTERLDGTVAVKVVAGEKEGEQKLIITSTNPEVTKDKAISALGSLKKMYHIQSLERKG